MKVQLIGGPCDQEWEEAREGQRIILVKEYPSIPLERVCCPRDTDLCIEHLYRLTAHNNCTFTFEYQG